MRLTLGINLDNAAFWTEGEELDRDEIAYVLGQVADSFAGEPLAGNIIRDRNGNRIGSWVLTES